MWKGQRSDIAHIASTDEWHPKASIRITEIERKIAATKQQIGVPSPSTNQPDTILKDAVKHYKRGNAHYFKGNPKYEFAYYNRGNAYKKLGDLDHAIADYDKTIKLNPKHGYAYYNSGICYQLKRQYKLALADFRKAWWHIPSTDERHGMASERIVQIKRKIGGGSSDQ